MGNVPPRPVRPADPTQVYPAVHDPEDAAVIAALTPLPLFTRPRGLVTIADYVDAAREASPMVRHVRVRCLQNDPRMAQGHVIVKVRRSWRRLLPTDELLKVHHYIARENPLGVRLEVK